MKGLFYKEGRCLWQYGKSYILLVVIFFGLTFLNKGGGGANPLWLLYPVFFVGSLPASLLSADERDGWLAYCDTLPIGRRQLVAAKYVTSAVLTALIITLVLLISALTGQPTVAGGTAVPLSILIPLLLAVGLGVPALMFPIMFKFGATKGRAVYRCGDDRVSDLRGADGIRIGKRGADRTSDFAGHHHYTGDIRRQLGAVREVVQGPGAVNRAEGGDYPPPSEKIAGKTGNGC